MTRTNGGGKTECFYRVTLSHPDGESQTFDLELADLSNELEYEVDGGTYLITIGGKVGVCFPLAESQCSPCRVYTCIPEKLLLTFQVLRDLGCVVPGQIVNIEADWVGTHYYGSADVGGDTVEVTVTQLTAQCGFHVEIDGIPEGGIVEPFDIILEGSIEPDGEPCEYYTRVANKLARSADSFATTYRGRAGCSGSLRTALVYAAFTIRDYDGEAIGTGVLKDGDCTVMAVQAAYRACCLKMEQLCPYTGYLHLGVIASTCSGGMDGFTTLLGNFGDAGFPTDGCFSDGESLIHTAWSNTQSPGTREIQCGPVGLCAPIFIEFYMACCYPPPSCDEVAPEDGSRYRLWLRRSSYDTSPVEASLKFFSCDPFLLEFEADAKWTTGGCDCCSEGGTMTIRVTK
jgi:hypothetical protein